MDIQDVSDVIALDDEGSEGDQGPDNNVVVGEPAETDGEIESAFGRLGQVLDSDVDSDVDVSTELDILAIIVATRI